MIHEIYKITKSDPDNMIQKDMGYKYDILHSNKWGKSYHTIKFTYLGSCKTLVEAINQAIKYMHDPQGSVLIVDHKIGGYQDEENLMISLRKEGKIK